MVMAHPLIYISPPYVLKFQKKQWVNFLKRIPMILKMNIIQ
jgi:hypothetical protein